MERIPNTLLFGDHRARYSPQNFIFPNVEPLKAPELGAILQSQARGFAIDQLTRNFMLTTLTYFIQMESWSSGRLRWSLYGKCANLAFYMSGPFRTLVLLAAANLKGVVLA